MVLFELQLSVLFLKLIDFRVPFLLEHLKLLSTVVKDLTHTRVNRMGFQLKLYFRSEVELRIHLLLLNFCENILSASILDLAYDFCDFIG